MDDRHDDEVQQGVGTQTTVPRDNRSETLQCARIIPKKAIDKGKAPMRDDNEQWTTEMVARSQGLSQPRALTGHDPFTVSGARAEVPVQRPGREDADVEVVNMRPHMEERRRIIQNKRADMKAFQDMHPPAYQGKIDYKAVDK
ncbi:hypothetical protein ACLOJK_037950 [Asimina triloba]